MRNNGSDQMLLDTFVESVRAWVEHRTWVPFPSTIREIVFLTPFNPDAASSQPDLIVQIWLEDNDPITLPVSPVHAKQIADWYTEYCSKRVSPAQEALHDQHELTR